MFFDDNKTYSNILKIRRFLEEKGIVNSLNEDTCGEIEVSYACVKQFLLDTLSFQELRKVFTKEELEWLERIAFDDDTELKKQTDVIIQYTLSTFQAINFLNNYHKNISRNNDGRSVSIINDKKSYLKKDKERVIDIGKYYTLKVGENRMSKSEQLERKIVRKTDKWIVSGHVRQYKSGKVIFVEAYYKGANKDSLEKSKTSFKIRDTKKNDCYKLED